MTRQQIRPFWLGLCAGAAVAVIAATSFFANSETVLRTSFATALTHASSPTKEVASINPISGSEDYWLTAMRRDDSAPMTKTVSVGDQITLTLSGHRRTFAVASVSDFAPQITEIDTSAGPEHFILVTARDVKDPNARPIRFVMEIDGANAAIIGGRGGRSL
jgi:hypothetical protein